MNDKHEKLHEEWMKDPVYAEEYSKKLDMHNSATYLLAQAVHHTKPRGARGQIITWHDSWWQASDKLVKELRKDGDKGVELFDSELRMGLYRD